MYSCTGCSLYKGIKSWGQVQPQMQPRLCSHQEDPEKGNIHLEKGLSSSSHKGDEGTVPSQRRHLFQFHWKAQ